MGCYKNEKNILFIILIILLSGCSNESTSIYGKITTINVNTMIVDCSEQVEKTEDTMSDAGYTCSVQITEKTTFRNQNREKLNIEDFQKESIVQVILTNPKTISQNQSSRDLEAMEIILINE